MKPLTLGKPLRNPISNGGFESVVRGLVWNGDGAELPGEGWFSDPFSHELLVAVPHRLIDQEASEFVGDRYFETG